MPDKRKRKDTKDYRAIKKTKSSSKDFMSYMIKDNQGGSSSDDSDSDSGGAPAFPAFDLPNYDVFNNDEDDSDDENTGASQKGNKKSKDDVVVVADSKDPKPGTSKTSKGDGGIIFLSDPSQLPKPLNFNTAMMKPVVLGAPSSKPQGKVVVMNPTTAKGQAASVPHVRPILLPQNRNAAKTNVIPPQSSRSASLRVFNQAVTNTSSVPRSMAPIATNKKFDTHVAVPVSNVRSSGVARGQGNTSANPPPRAANVLANAAASAVAAGMSATSIMQQVALAAQQASKGITRPSAMSTPNKNFRNIAPSNLQRPMFSPITANGAGAVVNGGVRNVRNGAMVINQRPQGQRLTVPNQQGRIPAQTASIMNGTATLAQASKWKPYSSTLAKVAKKVAKSDKKMGLNPSNQLNLKQMYSMLRLKFSTKQIYDMCLWDMEHSDASLMEIAINNAFT